jgi:shikimate kinase
MIFYPKKMSEAAGKATAKIIQTTQDKSASYALDMEARVSAEIIQGRKIFGNSPDYAKDLAKKTLKFLGYAKYGLSLKIDSNIPKKAGLGELEAISVATTLAVAGAIARKHGSVNELKIDVHTRHQFILIGDKLIDKNKLLAVCPGEYDRLFASLNGGFVVSDNRKKEIIRRGEMETMSYVAAIPKKSPKTDKDILQLYRHERDLIYEECCKGNLYGAMRLNTLLYRDETAIRMLYAGAITAVTTYPTTVGLTRDPKKIKDISKAAKGNKIITGTVGNTESLIQTKPRRIVKTAEFLGIKGDTEYSLL